MCKACDRYLELIRDDGLHHGQSDQDNDQDIMSQIIEFCSDLNLRER